MKTFSYQKRISYSKYCPFRLLCRKPSDPFSVQICPGKELLLTFQAYDFLTFCMKQWANPDNYKKESTLDSNTFQKRKLKMCESQTAFSCENPGMECMLCHAIDDNEVVTICQAVRICVTT